jgi:hypothetical protein
MSHLRSVNLSPRTPDDDDSIFELSDDDDGDDGEELDDLDGFESQTSRPSRRRPSTTHNQQSRLTARPSAPQRPAPLPPNTFSDTNNTTRKAPQTALPAPQHRAPSPPCNASSTRRPTGPAPPPPTTPPDKTIITLALASSQQKAQQQQQQGEGVSDPLFANERRNRRRAIRLDLSHDAAHSVATLASNGDLVSLAQLLASNANPNSRDAVCYRERERERALHLMCAMMILNLSASWRILHSHDAHHYTMHAPMATHM